ncbi:MAG: hypothetical protein XD43_0051 [Thermococcales archaeon 44_46]|nr:MAG: hypothetical protein XD43_0051 [Thermococcales archaeon 44_46]
MYVEGTSVPLSPAATPKTTLNNTQKNAPTTVKMKPQTRGLIPLTFLRFGINSNKFFDINSYTGFKIYITTKTNFALRNPVEAVVKVVLNKNKKSGNIHIKLVIDILWPIIYHPYKLYFS